MLNVCHLLAQGPSVCVCGSRCIGPPCALIAGTLTLQLTTKLQQSFLFIYFFTAGFYHSPDHYKALSTRGLLEWNGSGARLADAALLARVCSFDL